MFFLCVVTGSCDRLSSDHVSINVLASTNFQEKTVLALHFHHKVVSRQKSVLTLLLTASINYTLRGSTYNQHSH